MDVAEQQSGQLSSPVTKRKSCCNIWISKWVKYKFVRLEGRWCVLAWSLLAAALQTQS